MNLYINHQKIFMRKINRSIISKKYRKYRKNYGSNSYIFLKKNLQKVKIYIQQIGVYIIYKDQVNLFYIPKLTKDKIKWRRKWRIKKIFDNKNSILLKWENFLVCEIEIDSKSSRKLITFRSNEGIKNYLDSF